MRIFIIGGTGFIGSRVAVTYTAIPILLMAVAFAAALIPASRPARVEPVEALRHD